ncbi:YecH family protein [Vibrio alginolyticus]|uniref:YecH family metal-binding protein n=1 Tax=Vibrio alginolyticus TaxID=663 RepID=UPI001BD5433A|nr:YecH family metal-binding protein [Vibrio alginolyticus]MBT0082440.1 YecH family protein [Vibrio alginolyticus]MBT0105664.1 YecH family protein [Vibrio alginolyticus]MBT0110148.1 YecH family protein [Vibrio alginolyticus]
MSEIHAHELLNLLRETPMDREALTQHFGASVRFHTCKLNDLDLGALLAFLLKRDKIRELEGKFVVNMARVCNH